MESMLESESDEAFFRKQHLLLKALEKVELTLELYMSLPKLYLWEAELVEALEQNKITIAKEHLDSILMHNCGENGNPEIVKLLLTKADPTMFNQLPIRWAAERGNVQVVKLLLGDPRVDPAVNNNHPIRSAAFFGHTEIVELLLSDSRVVLSADDCRYLDLFRCASKRVSGNCNDHL